MGGKEPRPCVSWTPPRLRSSQESRAGTSRPSRAGPGSPSPPTYSATGARPLSRANNFPFELRVPPAPVCRAGMQSRECFAAVRVSSRISPTSPGWALRGGSVNETTVRRSVTRRAVLGMMGLSVAHAGRVRAGDRGGEADQKALVESNGQFAFDLYGKLRSAPGNAFFSPYSVSQALAMTLAGARGATADELARALRVQPDARLHPAFANLARAIMQADRNGRCELAI